MKCVNCNAEVSEGLFCSLCGWNQKHIPKTSTLENLRTKWMLTKHYRSLGPKGKRGYDLAWRFLLPLAAKPIQNIVFEDYQAVLDEMAVNDYSRSAQEKVQQLISQLNKLAMQDGLIYRNIAPDLALEGKEAKESLPFEDRHIPLLLECARSGGKYQEAARITLCLIFTGFRPEEFFSIRCEDLDPRRPFLMAGSKTEAGKNRKVPVLSVIQPYIINWYLSCPVANHQKQGYLVRGARGGRKDLHNWRNREFYPMTLELGINRPDELNRKRTIPHITPYSARHTFATLAYRAGVDKDALKQIIGHSSFDTTTKFYIHSETEALLREAQKIETYFKAM